MVLYRGQTKPLLIKIAVGQVLLLAGAGWLDQLGVYYWAFTVFRAAGTLAAIIVRVKLNMPEDCAWWFKFGCCGFTGGAMAAGMLGGYVTAIQKTSSNLNSAV